MDNDKEVEEKKVEGQFGLALKRNNKQIKDARAESIISKARVEYKRTVEDLELSLEEMKRDLDDMLDLSPENSMSLKVASDFNQKAFIEKDLELGLKIRNTEIKVEIATKRYIYLFGEL
jgi:hypothetical protein